MKHPSFPYVPLQRLPLRDYAQVNEEYRRPERCVHCGEVYLEAENIGRLQCRLHTGVREYDLASRTYAYSCCGHRVANAFLEPPQAVHGCVEADHCAEQLCDEDQAQRYEELFERAIAVIPCGRFLFGVMPPLDACILYYMQDAVRGGEEAERRRVFRWRPFARLGAPEHEHAFRVSEMVSEVGGAARRCPLLSREFARARGENEGRGAMLRQVEARWRTAPEREEADSGAGGGGGQFGGEQEFIIPFVIVKRLAL